MESRITSLAARPAPSRPNTPSPPFQHPAPPALQGHLRLFGFARAFATLSPRSPSQRRRQPWQQPHPWAEPEPGAPGQGLDLPVLLLQPHGRSIFPIPAGTSSPGSRAGERSRKCRVSQSILILRRGRPRATRCPRPGKLVTGVRGLGADSRAARPGRGAAGRQSCPRNSNLPARIFGARLRFSLDKWAESAQRSGEAAGSAGAASSDLGPPLWQSARAPIRAAATSNFKKC